MGDLDGDFPDGDLDWRLRLDCPNADAGRSMAFADSFRDHAGESFKRLIAALRCGLSYQHAYGAIVDGVLNPVGEDGIAIGNLEGDGELEPLTELELGGADAMMGINR